MRRNGPMSDQAFNIMAFCFRITDMFSSPSTILNSMGLKFGDTVIDYGCGPGRYIKKASQLVGQEGKVYAVDIHHLAIAAVQEMARKEKLTNVITERAHEYSVTIPDQAADIIYVLDMFHMVENTEPFLKELYRLLKPEGTMIIEPGHQSYSLARKKILASELWTIKEENRRFFKCTPRR